VRCSLRRPLVAPAGRVRRSLAPRGRSAPAWPTPPQGQPDAAAQQDDPASSFVQRTVVAQAARRAGTERHQGQPRPSAERFARAVVHAEFARDDGRLEFDVTQRIMTRLYRELSKLIGPTGFDVLLARSVSLARRSHPFLGASSAGPGGTLEGLDAATSAGAAPQEVALEILSRFTEVLMMLLGEDFALRLLQNVEPGMVDEEQL